MAFCIQTTHLLSDCYVLGSLLGARVNETDRGPGQSWEMSVCLGDLGTKVVTNLSVGQVWVSKEGPDLDLGVKETIEESKYWSRD